MNIVIVILGIIKQSRTTENPSKLYTHSLDSIRNSLNMNISKIISRIYLNIFNDRFNPQDSDLFYIFYFEVPASKEADLSNMNLERIPIEVARRMSKIELLNLAGNINLSINEDWFN
jgi:hypothetical protein